MSVSFQNRTICKFNLRGQCRFGSRCRNIHTILELSNYSEPHNELHQSTSSNSASSNTGACALSPTKSKSPRRNNDTQKQSPSPSSSNTYNSKGAASTSSVQQCQNSMSILSLEEKEEKTCGICFDVVLKKSIKAEQTFGMLPNCSHCFCFECIRKWRQSKEFDLAVSKACPECRVASDFVYPVRFWIEDKTQKDNYITRQKQKMKSVDCRYFKKGKGKCPFGNTCMFLHALPDGQECDVGPPKPRRRTHGSSTDELVQQIVFWLNDDELDLDTDDEDDDDFELDLDDPCIAYQYYERGDIRRYLAWERLLRADIDDSLSENDLSSPFFI